MKKEYDDECPEMCMCTQCFPDDTTQKAINVVHKLAIYEGEIGVYRIDHDDWLFGYIAAQQEDCLSEIPDDVLAEYMEILPRYEALMRRLRELKCD